MPVTDQSAHVAETDLQTAVLKPNASIGHMRWQMIRELVGLPSHSENRNPSPDDQDEANLSIPRPLSEGVEYDAKADTRYAREAPSFAHVAHIFHQNWHGIRSAAGVLPGHKVALPQSKLRHDELLELIARLHNWGIRKAVFHGFSHLANHVLKAVSGADIACYLVWHGSLAQLVLEPEVEFFNLALAACQTGRLRRAHMMKAGMGDIFPRSYEPVLLNSPPITGRSRLIAAFGSDHAVALVPAHTDIHKNIHTSLTGAALSDAIDDVLYFGKVRGRISAIERCKRIKYRGHTKYLDMLHDIDVVVNVTAIDCHPMVEMEALGAGAMALTGPRFLDALQKHPFTRLSTIDNPFSVKDIRDRLGVLRAMDNTELQEMMSRYTAELTSISHNRYSEFLEI
jgi:hypothetical protein